MNWWLVFAGGGLGAVMRFALSSWVGTRLPGTFPWGTLAVNVAGCLVLGFVTAWIFDRGDANPGARLFLATGVLGGFTTFSTFGLETWQLVLAGTPRLAFANAAASLVAGLIATALGVAAGRSLA